jgi:predicted small lipoprotein YifL
LAPIIADHRRKLALTLLAVAAIGFVAAGCGRRGEPERPGTAAVTQDDEARPVEDKAANDRPFVLDSLIQ